MDGVGFQHEGAILRGYAALARDESDVAFQHFLRAQPRGRKAIKLRWAKSLATRYPGHPIAHLITAHALAISGQRSESRIRIDTALRLDPNLTVAHLARGVLWAIDGERATAIEALDPIGTETSVSDDTWVARGITHLEAGNLEQARADLNRAVDQEPGHAIAYNAIGILHARHGEWVEAANNFEVAFDLVPGFTAARQNWQIAEKAAAQHGMVVVETRVQSNIAIASGSDANSMRNATAVASDIVQRRTGQTPIAVDNVNTALVLSKHQPVVLKVPGSGLNAVAGDQMLQTLKQIGSRANVTDIVTYDHDAGMNAAMAVRRHRVAMPPAQQTQISRVHFVEPSEVAGSTGRTPFPITDTNRLAELGSQIARGGIDVSATLTQGKIGIQHMNNVNNFRNIPEITTNVRQSQVDYQPGFALTGNPRTPVLPSITVANSGDNAVRNVAQERWITYRNNTEQHRVGTLPDILNIMQQHPPGSALSRMPSLPGGLPDKMSSTPGGVMVGSTHITRGSDVGIVIGTGARESGKLTLVYPLFGTEKEIEIHTSTEGNR